MKRRSIIFVILNDRWNSTFHSQNLLSIGRSRKYGTFGLENGSKMWALLCCHTLLLLLPYWLFIILKFFIVLMVPLGIKDFGLEAVQVSVVSFFLSNIISGLIAPTLYLLLKRIPISDCLLFIVYHK